MKKSYLLFVIGIIFISCSKDDATAIEPTANLITNNTTNTDNTTTDNTSGEVHGDWTISHRTTNGKEVDQTIWGICESQSTLTFKETSKADSNLCFAIKKTTSYSCKVHWCNNRDYSYNKENDELKFHAESLYITAKVLTLNANTLKMSYTVDGNEYVDTYLKK